VHCGEKAPVPHANSRFPVDSSTLT